MRMVIIHDTNNRFKETYSLRCFSFVAPPAPPARQDTAPDSRGRPVSIPQEPASEARGNANDRGFRRNDANIEDGNGGGRHGHRRNGGDGAGSEPISEARVGQWPSEANPTERVSEVGQNRPDSVIVAQQPRPRRKRPRKRPQTPAEAYYMGDPSFQPDPTPTKPAPKTAAPVTTNVPTHPTDPYAYDPHPHAHAHDPHAPTAPVYDPTPPVQNTYVTQPADLWPSTNATILNVTEAPRTHPPPLERAHRRRNRPGKAHTIITGDLYPVIGG